MTIPRAISSIVALIYPFVGLRVGGVEGMFRILPLLFLPLIGIWFPEEVGGYTGWSTYGFITTKSPSCMVSFLAWLILLLPLLAGMVYVIGFSK